MKICAKCQKQFKSTAVIDGKRKSLFHRKYCLDCSPYGEHNTCDISLDLRPAAIDRMPAEEFAELIRSSRSRSECFNRLKMRKSGASFLILNRRIKQDKLDISHFVSGGTGHTFNRKLTNDELFTISATERTGMVRGRILKDGLLEYKCRECKTETWLNKPLVLELDHINGNRYDNRLENLRFLCPNCHSQTGTFGGKKRNGELA